MASLNRPRKPSPFSLLEQLEPLHVHGAIHAFEGVHWFEGFILLQPRSCIRGKECRSPALHPTASQCVQLLVLLLSASHPISSCSAGDLEGLVLANGTRPDAFVTLVPFCKHAVIQCCASKVI